MLISRTESPVVITTTMFKINHQVNSLVHYILNEQSDK